MPHAKQTRRVTRASRDTLIRILETLPGALFFIDESDTIVYANASAQTMTGATREDLFGTSLWRGAPQLVSTPLYQAVQKAKQTQEPTAVEYVSPITNIWLHVSLSPTDEGLTLLFQEQLEPLHRQDILSRNEQMYRNLLESFADGVTIVTPEGLVLDVNQRPLADAHLRREEAIGKPLTDLPAWSSDPAVQQQLSAAIAQASQGETVRFEARIHPRTDLSLDILMTITSHRDASQQVEYLICASRDITERKHAEDEIHALIDAIPQLVWTGRPDGYIDSYNQRWRDYTGLTTAQAQGDGWMQCTHPDDCQRVLAVWQRAVQTGMPYEIEQRLRQGTTGDYRWFLMQATPYKDAQGTILKYVGTCTDIDDRKQAEERIKEGREHLRVLAETVPQLVWSTGPDGLTEDWNQRYADYFQATPEQLRGYGWRQFLHPEEYDHVLAVRDRSLAMGEPYEITYRLKDGKTGSYRWFIVRAMPVHDDTGQIIKWFGTCTDIDEQKRAEQRLKESEQNLRVLAETVPQFVWTARPDGVHEYTNQRWRDYTGFTPEHLQSDRWALLQFIHPDDREGARALWQHALDTGEMYEHEERIRNSQTGTYRWFLVRGLPVRDDAGQIVKWFGTNTDIEDQKRIEEALRQSQEQASALMNSSIIGIFVDEGEQIVDANDTFLRMSGYTREDLRAGRINWMHMTPPDYLARTQQAHQELATQQSMTPYEKEYVCKDGSRLPVIVGRVTFRTNPSQGIIFVLDNSARKELEQRKDDFISMASHEFKTPLTSVKMQAQLVRKRLERQGLHEAAAALLRVEEPVQRLERLTAELLDVSKIQVGRLEYVQEPVDLDALLREIADTMQQINPSHTLVVRGAAQTSLFGDRDRLEQVFTNLISNAIKYSPDAQTVEIDLDASPETVTIRVHDHGLGIPREQRDKVFERFYRAANPKKRAIPGLGMGLYIVAEIVKRHGGTITVDSAVGEGSTFTVTLPLARNALAW